MNRTLALAVALELALAPGVARADGSGDETPTTPPAAPATPAEAADAHVAKARALADKGDFDGARAEILAAYKLDPRPALLFALGQIEFNLHHYQAALDYYERFEATQPAADQAALAEQAIGAARAELSRPAVVTGGASKIISHREWDGFDVGMVAFGGIAIAAGGGLLYEAIHMANDHGGTLADYDARVLTARRIRIIAGASAGAGVIAIGAALLRWRFHFVDTTVEVQVTPTGAGVSLEHPL